jgi:hypothetical protein
MMGRVAGPLAGVLLAAALGGCGSSGTAEGDPEAGTATTTATPPATSSAADPAGEENDVRSTLAAGLAAVSPARAGLVRAEATTLTPVDTPWLTGWQVIDVESRTPPHPQRFYAALSEDGTALILSGSAESFAQMTRAARVVMSTASDATQVATVYLDATRTFASYSYRIASLGEVKWRPRLDAAGESRRADLERQYADLVKPPAAEPSATGWTVTAWSVDGTSLVRHHLTIAADGAVTDQPESVATDLPVPASV